MIYGPDGKPLSGPQGAGFVSPRWVTDEVISLMRTQAADRRVMDLRESCGVQQTVTGAPIGNTISIRKPSVIK